MIKPDQIPNEVCAAAIRHWMHGEKLHGEQQTMAEVIAAALNAWGIVTTGALPVGKNGGMPGFYLPMPEDNK